MYLRQTPLPKIGLLLLSAVLSVTKVTIKGGVQSQMSLLVHDTVAPEIVFNLDPQYRCVVLVNAHSESEPSMMMKSSVHWLPTKAAGEPIKSINESRLKPSSLGSSHMLYLTQHMPFSCL